MGFLRPSRSRVAAFTLLEMMVVVGVIAVVAAAAAPSIGSARADARAQEVALDMVRLLRRARSASAGYGRAHLVIFDPASDSGNGSLTVYRGINNRCNANDWPLLIGGGCPGNDMCIDAVEGDQQTFGTSNYRMRAPDFAGGMQVCFEPTGITRWRRTVATAFTSNNVDGIGSLNGGFRFTVQRYNGEGDQGVTRRVVLPLGSDARIQR
ncbi:MAG: prepilin-type N-terminal cleavage/methylation domain-containing protein [Myxococcota bacterium]